jgi:hypothetical protein
MKRTVSEYGWPTRRAKRKHRKHLHRVWARQDRLNHRNERTAR